LEVKGLRCLDLAAGPGDFALELLKSGAESVVCADFCPEMLAIAREKIKEGAAFVECSAEKLPFEDRSFDIITVGFGVRNFEDGEKAYGEMRRVLKPGGRLCVLEITGGRGLFGVYFNRIMPLIGNFVSGTKAYKYLAESVERFDTPEEMAEKLAAAGFDVREIKKFALGSVVALVCV
jgi:demethylmenaquinone methyltransferase/2-methoxy-6-polyprenyl-1,4-benzoquinol methylase